MYLKVNLALSLINCVQNYKTQPKRVPTCLKYLRMIERIKRALSRLAALLPSILLLILLLLLQLIFQLHQEMDLKVLFWVNVKPTRGENLV